MDKERSARRNTEAQNSNMPIKKKSNKKKNSFLLILKGTVLVLCLIGFFFNSYIIFKQFIEKETVTSYKIEETSKLHLPSVTFCGNSGFKRIVENYSDFELQNYINNTVKLSEIVKEVTDHNNKTYKIAPDRSTTFDGSGKWKIIETYSAYRGRCYTIEYKELVKYIKGYIIYFLFG